MRAGRIVNVSTRPEDAHGFEPAPPQLPQRARPHRRRAPGMAPAGSLGKGQDVALPGPEDERRGAGMMRAGRGRHEPSGPARGEPCQESRSASCCVPGRRRRARPPPQLAESVVLARGIWPAPTPRFERAGRASGHCVRGAHPPVKQPAADLAAAGRSGIRADWGHDRWRGHRPPSSCSASVSAS